MYNEFSNRLLLTASIIVLIIDVLCKRKVDSCCLF